MPEAQAELTIRIRRLDGRVYVLAAGSRGERPRSHLLDPSDASNERLDAFTAAVARTIESGSRLDAAVRAEAYALHEALFQGPVRAMVERLGAASAQSPPLVRLMIDPELQAFPWEALCEPETPAGFLGTSPRMLLARGVSSNELGEARHVSGAVRVLAVAPLPVATPMLQGLESALAEPIETGAIAWLPPIAGDAARTRALFKELRRRANPHVLHFMGYGAVDAQGRPQLRLADGWILAESLAQELAASFGGDLRLIVLDACAGAWPGVFGSAAEVLVRGGAQAVVAHLWSIRSDNSRELSRELYRTLAGTQRARGDIVASLTAARCTLLLTSAEAFSPVVYLRGGNPALIDFRDRPLGGYGPPGGGYGPPPGSGYGPPPGGSYTLLPLADPAGPAPTPPRPVTTSIKLFYCYSHKDESLRDELETHLTALKRQALIEGWHDRRIGAGIEWAGAIDDSLEKAQIILLLVSADFVASDYCYGKEMKRALERHEAREALVIPIALRPCDWSGAPFAKLQGLPRDLKPVITWTHPDEAWTDIAKGVRRAVDELRACHA